VAESTELFFLAESLGGVESLIELPGPMTHASVSGSPIEVPDTLIRLSVGIEHPDDLVAISSKRSAERSTFPAHLSVPGDGRHHGRVMRELGSNVRARKDRSVLTARR
jgi:hypothetical protein